MVQRTRQFSRTRTEGVVYTLDHGYYEVLGRPNVRFLEQTTTDSIAKGRRKDRTIPPSDFDTDKVERAPMVLNGDSLGKTFYFQGYATGVDYLPSLVGYTTRTSPNRSSENSYYTQLLLAATNPFRPEYSVPVAIRELIDLSLLFKLAASTFAGIAAGGYLNYQFGWLSFVRDVRTLHGITKALERRIKELNSLGLHGGLRRKVKFGTVNTRNASGTNYIYHSTWGVYLYADWTVNSNTQMWGTVRWKWTKEGITLTPLEQFNIAVEALFDLGEVDPQTMWNLIPFSWLVDYFMSFSDYFTGDLGYSYVEPYDICIMREFRSTETWKNTTNHATCRSSGTAKYWRHVKSRDVWTKGAFPVPRVGLFTQTQLLVLAALLTRLRGA